MPKKKKNAVIAVKEPFPLLQLPPEIRNSIWYLIVVMDQPIMIRKRHNLAESTRPSLNRSGKRRKLDLDQQYAASKLSVAFTCRLVYLEVTPIYYSKNTFELELSKHTPASVGNFLADLGPEKARSIQSIYFKYSWPHLIQILPKFPNLRRISVDHKAYCGYYHAYPSGKELVEYVKTNPGPVLTCRGGRLSSQMMEKLRREGRTHVLEHDDACNPICELCTTSGCHYSPSSA